MCTCDPSTAYVAWITASNDGNIKAADYKSIKKKKSYKQMSLRNKTI